MRVTTRVLPTDERPDHEDLAPFFERPKAIRIEGSEDLSLFRIICEYRLTPESERTDIRLAAFMFIRLEDGRLERVAFRLARPRVAHAYDESASAFAAIRAHAASLADDEPHKARLRSGAEFLLARWRREEVMLRALLTPPF